MNWADIEAKWQAMTRRVQSDQSQNVDDLVTTLTPDLPQLLRDEMTELGAPTPLVSPAP